MNGPAVGKHGRKPDAGGAQKSLLEGRRPSIRQDGSQRLRAEPAWASLQRPAPDGKRLLERLDRNPGLRVDGSRTIVEMQDVAHAAKVDRDRGVARLRRGFARTR